MLYKEKPLEIATKVHEDIIAKHDYLSKKYGEAVGNRALLRYLILSTPGSEPILEDFPGDDSIEKFVDELLEKYSQR